MPAKLLKVSTSTQEEITPGKEGVQDWQAQVLQQGQQPRPGAPGVCLQLLGLLLAASFIALISALPQPLCG